MSRVTLVRTLAVALLIVLAPQVGFGQSQTTASPQQGVRDAQAVVVVQTALAAMGGTAIVSLVQNSVVQGTSVDLSASESGAQSFVWTYSGKEFRNENDAATGSHILVSNGGNPTDFHDGAWVSPSPVVARTNLPYHIPALVLLNELNNANYTFTFLGSTTVNGSNATHIQTCDNSDITGHFFTPQDWYFDSVTGLPLRVEYLYPISQDYRESLHGSIDFSSFNVVTGILVPFQLTINEGPFSSVASMNSVVFNSTLDPSVFAPSTGSVQ
jgi:hypothetical protein